MCWFVGGRGGGGGEVDLGSFSSFFLASMLLTCFFMFLFLCRHFPAGFLTFRVLVSVCACVSRCVIIIAWFALTSRQLILQCVTR